MFLQEHLRHQELKMYMLREDTHTVCHTPWWSIASTWNTSSYVTFTWTLNLLSQLTTSSILVLEPTRDLVIWYHLDFEEIPLSSNVSYLEATLKQTHTSKITASRFRLTHFNLIKFTRCQPPLTDLYAALWSAWAMIPFHQFLMTTSLLCFMSWFSTVNSFLPCLKWHWH